MVDADFFQGSILFRTLGVFMSPLAKDNKLTSQELLSDDRRGEGGGL